MQIRNKTKYKQEMENLGYCKSEKCTVSEDLVIYLFFGSF